MRKITLSNGNTVEVECLSCALTSGLIDCWPRNVPKGTPVTVATVSPENIMEIALALRSSGTKSAAIVEPMDIKTPCENAETIRPINKAVMLVALAASELPKIKIIMIQSNKDLRDILDVSVVRNGAPNVTLKAYKETVNPAVAMLECKSSAISGNKPTLTNSVVPIANALIANYRLSNALRVFIPFFSKGLAFLGGIYE